VLKIIYNFLHGCKFALAGIGKFFKTPKYYLYALLPIAISLVIYLICGILCFMGATNFIDWVVSYINSSNCWQWLKTTGDISVNLIAWLTFFAIWLGFCLLLFEAFYEMFGSLFFDKLAEVYCKDKYKRTLAKVSLKDDVKFVSKSILYGVKHLFIGLIILLVAFIPIVGLFFLIPYRGYRIAQAAMLSSFAIMGIDFTTANKTLKKNKSLILGFGVVGFLFMLIPGAIVFVLPGLVIGGVDLYISYLEGKEVSE
jgi:CysZ protein